MSDRAVYYIILLMNLYIVIKNLVNVGVWSSSYEAVTTPNIRLEGMSTVDAEKTLEDVKSGCEHNLKRLWISIYLGTLVIACAIIGLIYC